MENKLKEYQEKRRFNKTKEPRGKIKKKSKKLAFCVQHHLASKDHYDFRLEYNGVLLSFAVPKGPSYNPQDKRLAIHVEDHPYNYKNFEGIIPSTEYGGGTVMLFDIGYYQPLEPFDIKKGILKFELYGKRLKGKWSIIHFKEQNFLLIKEKDNIKGFKDIKNIKTSVKTGRTMNQIKHNILKFSTDFKNNIVEDIKITHPEKVIFKKEKITKLDIIKYYQKVSKRMMPFLQKRLISTIRCPSGNIKETFFKKHLDNSSKGIKKVILKSSNLKNDYYYLTDVRGLISEVQLNSYEFHLWGSSASKISHPNIMVFDLDPDEKLDIKALRQGVLDLKNILDNLNLKSYLKTSGGKGYHIVVPISSIKTWSEFKATAHKIALLLSEKWPLKYTVNMRKKDRQNKIFIDWMRNTKGATFVCPYSLRLRPHAPISLPIKWSDLTKIKPSEVTLQNVSKYLKRKDPWSDFFSIKQ